MALYGGLGGLGVGSGSNSTEVAGFATVLGWLGGLFAGSQMQKVEPIFQVQLTNRGWVLTPVSRQARSGRPAVQTA